MLSPGSSHLGKRDVICRETCFCSRVQANSLGPSGAELTQGWVSAPDGQWAVLARLEKH